MAAEFLRVTLCRLPAPVLTAAPITRSALREECFDFEFCGKKTTSTCGVLAASLPAPFPISPQYQCLVASVFLSCVLVLGCAIGRVWRGVGVCGRVCAQGCV